MNFTWKSAQAAQEAFLKLKSLVNSFKSPSNSFRTILSQEKLKQLEGKDIRGSKGVKKIIELLENLKEINQDIYKLFEVKEKVQKILFYS